MQAKDLIDYLIGQGYNVYSDPNYIPVDLTESQLPALFVFSTGGNASHDYLPIHHPTFQIIIKGKSYKLDITQMEASELLAKQIMDLLDNGTNYVIGTSFVYYSKAIQSDEFSLGLDDNDRPTFSINFQFKLREM